IELQKRIAQFEDFNRIVAHNLRGPASSIQMILAMMADSESDAEKSQLFLMLNQSSTKLNDTLNDLMKVLEVRTNSTLPYDNCDLAEIVAGVEAMLTGQIISKNAKIHTTFEAPTLKFPKIYLESIFYNMISNSLKYSKADIPPEITITSRAVNDKVILTFKDNGLGIDLAQHGDNMFKLNKIFHKGFDSKGVGLFMTKIQIETFGGSINVESKPNVGTTFTIEL
ncbi:MAG: HAMP domain-containing sensor histidine kinase, partial [Mucilaginibacter sp.]